MAFLPSDTQWLIERLEPLLREPEDGPIVRRLISSLRHELRSMRPATHFDAVDGQAYTYSHEPDLLGIPHLALFDREGAPLTVSLTMPTAERIYGHLALIINGLKAGR